MTALAAEVVERLFIGGRWTEAAGAGRLDLTNPASGGRDRIGDRRGRG